MEWNKKKLLTFVEYADDIGWKLGLAIGSAVVNNLQTTLNGC